MDKMKKTLPYEKNVALEKVLGDLNGALYTLEREYISSFDEPQYPVIFIAGTQRSGTTLLMQLMKAYFEVGYVSNLMARFWKAPYIGALLFNELHRKGTPQPPDFISELGGTYNYEGPHEFGYFWQYWFPYNETHQTSERDLEVMDVQFFRQELAAIEGVFDAPLVFKNPIVFSLNMAALAAILPNAVFLVCKRDPLYIAQSTLLSRLKFHSQKEQWFSIKPREYTWLKNRPYPEQIAGQIFYTEQRIAYALEQIAAQRYCMIEYDDLCANPGEQLRRIQEMIAGVGYELKRTDFNPAPFQNTNVQKVENEEFELLKRACESFYNDVNPKGDHE